VLLHESLRGFVDQGLVACAMEASSIGLDESRLAGVRIKVAVFTNLTQDHLDYHRTMDAYWAAKRQLFAWPGLQAAVVNVDDAQGALLAVELAALGDALWCVSAQPRASARLTASRVHYQQGGLAFDVVEQGDHKAVPVRTTLVGDYNVHNLLGVLGALRALGVSLNDACAAMTQLTPVPGRMQRVGAAHEPLVVVDYAHTPDAVTQVLKALAPLARERGGQLVCILGCGGDRDASKRPKMAAAAEWGADRLVLTSDNPRSESPAKIIDDMVQGLRDREAVATVEDRRQAITQAVQRAQSTDVILVAGKGHEDYQDVRGVKHPFSDVLVVQQALATRRVAA
jgi:UDP-N-acetylmuramoyl-L-alanyl-D-glutamate--2,6-diaminopimelate ligase